MHKRSFLLPKVSLSHTQCIVLYDYDPEKMSPSDTPQLELKVAEGNLLRCYNRPASDNDEYTLAEVSVASEWWDISCIV